MSTRAFAATTFAWLRLLKADRDTTALAVGVQLIEHFNEREGGVAYPGSDFMAAELGLSQSTVVRALHRMHGRGRIKVEWGKPGRGSSNRIWMVVKHAPEHVSGGGKHAPARRRKHAPEENKTCASAYEPLSNHREEGSATHYPSSPGENDSLPRVDSHVGAGRAPEGAAGPRRPEEQTTAEIIPPSAIVKLDRERAFRELRALWHRGHTGDDTPKAIAIARRCYDRARDGGASHDDIMAGAKVHVAAANAPCFLTALPQWLMAQGWKHPPPARKPRRSGRHRDGLPRTNGNRVDVTKVALMQGGYVEDENGNLYHPDDGPGGPTANPASMFYGLKGGLL